MPDPDAGRPPAEVTTFVGRRDDIARVRSALATSRLVTLVGPGGVGKTRLALRVAVALRRALPDGAWVDLTPALDRTSLVTAVLAALGVRERAGAPPSEVLLDHLRDRETLLVLDNCEQVVDGAADLVAALLVGAPGLRVVATSREPLAIPGEHVHPVRPFDPPGPDDPLGTVRENDAVALFVARAAAASGAFAVTEANGAAVVEICRRLDGLPLAIELAAVRTRSLSPEQISARLDDRFALLTGGRGAAPRQRTLEGAIDWSHDLLSEDERRLFATLSVFAGRFTLDDVQAVCAGGRPDVLPTVAALVDKSLVATDDVGGLACYRLHETVREYAKARLVASGTAEVLAERFAAHYLDRCAAFAVESRHRLLAWMPWVELEIDNVRAVLRRSLEPGQDGERGLALATSLVWFWVTRATGEGVRWLDALLPAAPAPAPAWALFVRGFLAVQQGDPAVAVPVLARGVAAARSAGDLPALAQALAMGSIAATLAGDRRSSARLLAEAAAVADGLGDDLGATLMVLQARAQNGLADGDLDLARAAASEGIAHSRTGGDVYSLGMMLLNAGFAELVDGELAEAEGRFVEALDVAGALDDRVAQCYLVGGIGACAAGTGQHRRAARLLGAAETLQTEVGGNPHAAMAPALLAAGESARAALGTARFTAERDAGRALGRPDAIRLARGQEPADVDPGPRLSRRETEVAHLVADGLTNKEIGAALFLSERTVESHVRAILAKLGFRSRAQIARSMPARD